MREGWATIQQLVEIFAAVDEGEITQQSTEYTNSGGIEQL